MIENETSDPTVTTTPGTPVKTEESQVDPNPRVRPQKVRMPNGEIKEITATVIGHPEGVQ